MSVKKPSLISPPSIFISKYTQKRSRTYVVSVENASVIDQFFMFIRDFTKEKTAISVMTAVRN